jgi:hypothetical protein
MKKINLKHIFFISIIILLVVIFFIIVDFYLDNKSKKNSIYDMDKNLGWVLKKNFSKEFVNLSLNKTKYLSTFSSTSERGYNFYEKPDLNKKKILVLGDSFVVNQYHGNKSAWWNVLRKKINEKYEYQFYVAGSPGYSSVQQLLLLRNIVKTVKPDIFILGFCTYNDFYENNKNMAEWGIIRHQTKMRPYYDLKTKKIKRLDDLNSKIYRFLFNSFFLRKIDNIYMRIQQRIYKDYYIGPYKDLFNENIIVTEKILEEMRELIGKDTLFISVDCTMKPNDLNQIWQKMIRKLNGYPIDEHRNVLYKLALNNKELFHIDGFHLSSKGQKLYGELLFDLIDQEFLKRGNTN